MHRCRTFAVDPASIDRIQRPRAVQFQPTGRADAHFAHRYGIERLNRMQTNTDHARLRASTCAQRGHAKSLADSDRPRLRLVHRLKPMPLWHRLKLIPRWHRLQSMLLSLEAHCGPAPRLPVNRKYAPVSDNAPTTTAKIVCAAT